MQRDWPCAIGGDTDGPLPDALADVTRCLGEALDQQFPTDLAKTMENTRRTNECQLRGANVTEARPVLAAALAGDRIGFEPASDGGWELAVPIAFDQMMKAAIPALARLQDLVASPAGFEPALPA